MNKPITHFRLSCPKQEKMFVQPRIYPREDGKRITEYAEEYARDYCLMASGDFLEIHCQPLDKEENAADHVSLIYIEAFAKLSYMGSIR